MDPSGLTGEFEYFDHARGVSKIGHDHRAFRERDGFNHRIRSLGHDITMIEVMQDTVKNLDGGWLKTEPITESMVRFVVGTTFNSLGRFAEAVPQLQRARELDQQYRSPDDPQITVTLSESP